MLNLDPVVIHQYDFGQFKGFLAENVQDCVMHAAHPEGSTNYIFFRGLGEASGRAVRKSGKLMHDAALGECRAQRFFCSPYGVWMLVYIPCYWLKEKLPERFS